MRLAVPRLRVFVCLVALVVAAGPTLAEAQPVTTVARAGWRVGGNVSAAARLGNVLYIGGNIRGIAPEGNVAAGVLAVDAATGAIIPGFALLNGNVIAIEPDGAGGFYVGGNFLDTVVGGTVQPRIRLVHLLANGAIDTTFAATVDGGAVRALELVPGVGLFVGGDFSGLNGAARSRVGLVDAITGATQPWTYNVAGTNSSVRALVHDDGQLVVGGTFATVDGLARANLVVVSASAVGQVGPDNGVDALVEALHAPTAGTIYVGGGFAAALGSPRARLARVTHAAGVLTLALDPWNPGADGSVRSFAGGTGTVFAGGDFFNVGGAQRRRLGELDVATGAATAFDAEVEGVINSVVLAGDRLFAAGSFSDAGGAERNAAAALSPTNAAALAWNPSPAGTVSAVAVSGNTVLLGGTIVGFGAIARSNLAALDLQAGTVLPWNPRADGNQIDEIIISGNRVFVSGNFFFAGGEQRIGVAEFDPIFGEASEWNPVLNGSVSAMVLDGTSAYLGGTFTTVNGQPRPRLARVDLATGAVDPTFTPSAVGGAPMDLLLSGSTLFVGGAFTRRSTPLPRFASRLSTPRPAPSCRASRPRRTTRFRSWISTAGSSTWAARSPR